MRVYALYQGRFVEGWIPDDYFSMRVRPALSNGRPLIPDKRSLSRRLFATEAFPDVAYFINGQWFTTDYRVIAPDQLLGHVFADGEEVYLKLEGTGRGVGVRRLGRSGFERAIQSITENGVIQRPIVQHPWFDEIYPDAVATLRITTSYLDAAGPRFRASYLRIGYAGRTHVEAEKSLRWAVIDREGSMAGEALDETWRPHSRHPDSGFVFQDSQIPFFHESVDTCLRLHARMPHCHIVGWDVGITKTGSVEIMEWNSGHTDIKFSEATVGPIFLDCGFERFAGIENRRAAARELRS
ncbi:MAG: hypothetical protein JRG95_22260 [Deltaproteobacteria bacterium]|nr:hypothetical protein [Deltaproteobacteria bacterium]